MSVPNQIIIEEFVYEPCNHLNKDEYYAKINIKALQHALQDLPTVNALRLWLYLSKNKDGFKHLELSSTECVMNWGLGKSQWTQAKQTLADRGYLVPMKEDGKTNKYRFIQNPESGEETGIEVVEDFPETGKEVRNPETGNMNEIPDSGKNAVVEIPDSGNNSTISGLNSPEIVGEILQYNIYNNNIDNIMECTSCSLEYAMKELGCQIVGQVDGWVVVKTRTGKEIKFKQK